MTINPHPMTCSQERGAEVLHLSLSEINALSWRAIRGSGRTWGEAEEGAGAACWLARAGLDWASALIGLLSMPAGGANCPLRAGVRLADFACLPDGIGRGETHASALCHPVFLLPFAARVAAQSGQALRLDWDGASAWLAPSGAPRLEGAFDAAGPVAVRIKPGGPSDGDHTPWPAAHRSAISPAQYASLDALTQHVTVPASATSLAGAGAQGDDND